MNDLDAIANAIDDLRVIAVQLGLRPPEVQFEIVPPEIMYEVAASVLPIRFNHWTQGADYFRQKTTYDHGMQRIYEMVINSDPTQAWLMTSNKLVEQKMVIAHVYAHADFFQRNIYFRDTDRQMHKTAAAHAEQILALEEEHGLDEVETILDAAIAIGMHVDPQYRAPDPDEKPTCDCRHNPDYDDIWQLHGGQCPHHGRKQKNRQIPAEPQHDLLRFLADYSPAMEGWQRAIIEIVREEMLYFWPNIRTKVMNEGWATFWHERILEHADLTPDEHMQFRRSHAGVIGSSSPYHLNPYGLGYHVWRDIEERWDRPEAERTWYGEDFTRAGGQGMAKLFEVAATCRDSEFVRDYLSERVVRELDLFVFKGHQAKIEGITDRYWVVEKAEWQQVRDTLADELLGCGLPSILVQDGDHRRQRELLLRHDHESDRKVLDIDLAKRTLTHVQRLWGRPVTLETVVDGKAKALTFDGEKMEES